MGTLGFEWPVIAIGTNKNSVIASWPITL